MEEMAVAKGKNNNKKRGKTKAAVKKPARKVVKLAVAQKARHGK